MCRPVAQKVPEIRYDKALEEVEINQLVSGGGRIVELRECTCTRKSLGGACLTN